MTQTRGLHGLRVYLEMIKFEHSVFALPFAMIGMMWGSRWLRNNAWPGWWDFAWIVVAMVSCRSAAMAFNRVADRDIDAANPRTKMRALPAGLLSLRQANLYFYGSCVLFFVAAFMLNRLAFELSPIALGITLFYSVTKRFTAFCHFILGLSLGIAPAAAWIGVTGTLHPGIVAISGAVLLWTAGFDIIYALQDVDFDKEHKLHSLPEKLGTAKALGISRFCHFDAIILLLWGGAMLAAGPIYYGGVAFAAGLLIYEQSLVKPDDLSKVNLAFFTLNGFVSIGIFIFALVDQLVRR